MNRGLTFIPKYVRQESDMNYGEVITHENYNEKLNLNTTQGDYNTYVLLKLLTCADPDNTFHIPYLDKEIDDCNAAIQAVDQRVDATNLRIDELDTRFTTDINNINDAIGALSDSVDERFDDTNQRVTNLEDGTTPIPYAQRADMITGADEADPNHYYGTDVDGNLGFIPLPPFVTAHNIGPAADIQGVYYTPLPNSIAESMLSPELRDKINVEFITDYRQLSNLPQINGITLTGNKSLSELGVQPAGSYVTTSSLSNTLANYYTITAAQNWVNNKLTGYATTSALATTNSNVATAQQTANNAVSAAATAQARANQGVRVGINSYVSNPQNGDLYFQVA